MLRLGSHADWQSEAFNTSTRVWHDAGGGPYDAAALFMLFQLDHMVSANPAPDSTDGLLTLETAEKIRATLPNCQDGVLVETCLARTVRQCAALNDSAPECYGSFIALWRERCGEGGAIRGMG